jgi:hypothetical protein
VEQKLLEFVVRDIVMSGRRTRCDGVCFHELPSAIDHLDRALVARIRVFGPGHQPVVGEDHSLVVSEVSND